MQCAQNLWLVFAPFLSVYPTVAPKCLKQQTNADVIEITQIEPIAGIIFHPAETLKNTSQRTV